jgi:hypothetical protein
LIPAATGDLGTSADLTAISNVSVALGHEGVGSPRMINGFLVPFRPFAAKRSGGTDISIHRPFHYKKAAFSQYVMVSWPFMPRPIDQWKSQLDEKALKKSIENAQTAAKEGVLRASTCNDSKTEQLRQIV